MYLFDNYFPVYLEKAIDLSIFFIGKCVWWGKAENGIGGEEMEFFILNAIKLVKMHSDGKLIVLAINIYTNNETLRIIWKFDFSSRWVLGRIMEALAQTVLRMAELFNSNETIKIDFDILKEIDSHLRVLRFSAWKYLNWTFFLVKRFDRFQAFHSLDVDHISS